ncbi:MAG: TetR/AcrR family transcriptional regulator [Solirubrobacteraceae bacterium]
MSAGERREAILAAAMEVFSRRGYHGTSIDGIAQAAGISKALIYEHFASKKELHGSLLQAQVDDLFERLAASAAAGGEPELRLRRGLDTFFAFVQERRDAWRMLFRDAVDPDVADQLQRVQAQATGLIAALMASDPDMPPPDEPEAQLLVEMLAQQLSGAMQSLANWWFDHQEVPRQALVGAGVDFAWTGLERARELRRA